MVSRGIRCQEIVWWIGGACSCWVAPFAVLSSVQARGTVLKAVCGGANARGVVVWGVTERGFGVFNDEGFVTVVGLGKMVWFRALTGLLRVCVGPDPFASSKRGTMLR